MNIADSALVELKLRYAREQFIEPTLPLDPEGHSRRILAWRQWDLESGEMVEALAGKDKADEYRSVPWPPASVTDSNKIVAAGANLSNGIAAKMAWLGDFHVRLKTREDLRNLRN